MIEKIVGHNLEYFSEKKCNFTASEISQQPKMWRLVANYLLKKEKDITSFMTKVTQTKGLRTILTGAGSSAFIGETIAAVAMKDARYDTQAIHTTDIVTYPYGMLLKNTPTLLVSFGRSGNSPESIGAINHCRKYINDFYEIAICCEENSMLSKLSQQSGNGLTLIMPEGTNDKGFAMTSSVSCMLLAAYSVLNYNNIGVICEDIRLLADKAEKCAFEYAKVAQQWAKYDFDRMVFLGCGAFKGISHESSIKMLELSNGQVNTNYDTSAGFRHGPKTVINDTTITLHYISNNEYTAQYDIDLINEVYREKKGNKVFAVCDQSAKGFEADGKVVYSQEGYKYANEICTAINALLYAQIFAMYKSIELKITTDDPCPSGEVNRVVKGIKVYQI